MENSLCSAVVDKPAASNGASRCSEESGWTAYLEDFSNDRREEDSFRSGFGGSSWVSDAASSAAWKTSKGCDLVDEKAPRKLSFKKPRTRKIFDDDSLEDTASSPVNSPKVADLRPSDMSSRKTIDHHSSSSVGRGDRSSENYSELCTQERNFVNFNEKDECSELKKRGLRLVPLSMIVNYLG